MTATAELSARAIRLLRVILGDPGGPMLVLDTALVDRSERAEAYQSAVSANCTTSAATFEQPHRLWAHMHSYDVGLTKVLTIDASGTALRRTPRMARAMNECPIALALPLKSANRFAWAREERVFAATDMILVDLSAPYDYEWRGDGASYALHVDYDVLAVPMDLIVKAMPALASSPIYTLVRDHVRRMITDAQAIVDSGAALEVGNASIDLMRALIVSAAGAAESARQAMRQSLAARVEAYVAHHLRDADLSPAKIAAANAVSVRQLYRVYEALGVSLEASIIERRLTGAHAALAASGAEVSIAQVAAAWGFRSPSFFAERFKQRYGMTPREWRARRTAVVLEAPQSPLPQEAEPAPRHLDSR